MGQAQSNHPPLREVLDTTPSSSPSPTHHLPASKGCSESQESPGAWHRWWHKGTRCLKPKVGGWVGSRWPRQAQGSQRQTCRQPSTQEQGAGLICQAVSSASRGGTANKTKTKKLIIFGFFLINIQTGPAGSSALEGERRRRKKHPKPNAADSLSLVPTFPFVSGPPVYLLSETVRVSH